MFVALEEGLRAATSDEEIERLYPYPEGLARRLDFPYHEPTSLEDIKASRPAGPRRMALDLSENGFFDKIYVAWLGRCAGCLLGKPVEGRGDRNLP